MKINETIYAFFGDAVVTETLNQATLLIALARKQPIGLHLIDGSGYSEREVAVAFENGEYILVCQEYDDTERCYKFRTARLDEAWKRLKNYACETALTPSEAYM